MATSGILTHSPNSLCTYQLKWELVSQSAETNKSVINWEFILVTGPKSAGTFKPVEYGITAYVYFEGGGETQRSPGLPSAFFENNATKTVMSGTSTVWDNDGDGKISTYALIYFPPMVGVTEYSSIHIWALPLPTIYEKSTVSASDGTLGKAQKLTINRESSELTHTITYKCGTASGTICTKSSSTSISFTPPLSLASQNTTGESVSIELTITTYSPEVTVGVANAQIICAIPDSVIPSISIDVSDPLGHMLEYGYYIQKRSKIKVDITAAGAYGSTIGAYKTECDGKAYTGATVETDVITGAGIITVVSTVTDTRGRQATAEKTIEVTSYNSPGISGLSVRRTNADGTSNSSGGYLTITFDATATSLDGQNSAIYTLQYKKASDTNYTSVSLTAFSGLHYVDDGTFTFAADKSSTYNLILTIADDFGSTYRIGAGSPAQKLFSILFRGLGFAFGKDAELEGVLDIGFQTKFTGGILHPVLESGTDLNDVLTPNTYTAAAFDVSQFGHSPAADVTVKGFMLEVIAAGASGELIQRATVFTDSGLIVYHRLYSGGVWAAAWT